MTTSLPVLMYHYVCNARGPIAVSPERFEEHCRGMAQNGWRGIGLDEAEGYLRDKISLPPKSVLITFDDGFLDNYVYAWPLLEKYGHKGVVFAVTRRLSVRKEVRPTLKDRWAGIHSLDLSMVDELMQQQPQGYAVRKDVFLSWEEARRMEESGVMTVAGHTAGHTLVFSDVSWKGLMDEATLNTLSQDALLRSAEALFHVPGHRGNTFYRVEPPFAWGMPRFAEHPAMAGPAFVPSPTLVKAIQDLVPQSREGAFVFFQNGDNVRRLAALVRDHVAGELESDESMRVRITAELSSCRETLARELGHPVSSLCWPWGRASQTALDVGRQLGFSVFFTTKTGANPPGKPLSVHRFKVRDQSWLWLQSRLALYSRPWLADLYGRLRG